MKKIGRPKIDAKIRKGGVFSFRVNKQEREEIEQAASKKGLKPTTYARETLLASARDVG